MEKFHHHPSEQTALESASIFLASESESWECELLRDDHIPSYDRYDSRPNRRTSPYNLAAFLTTCLDKNVGQ